MKIQLREPKSHPVVIGFMGDIGPGFPVYKPISKSQRLLELLATCDLVVANLESPLTTAPSIKVRGISMCSDPSSVRELKELNIKVANLANNHIIDHGLAGLEESQRVLTKNGISWFGAGRDIKHASKPFMFEFTAGQIAFLAYSYKAITSPSLASVHVPGANPLILNDAKKQIGSLRDKGYIVCTSYHGGDEFFRVPCPRYRTVLRELAQAGAHLVIGHHAHVFQGIEIFNGNIIANGLGSFYLYPPPPRKVEHKGTVIGLFLTIELDRWGPCAYSVYFVYNDRTQRKLSIIQGQKRTELLRLFKHISNVLTDQTDYIREWRLDCCRMALGMNDASNILWLQRLPSRLYRFSKFALKASVESRKSKKNKSQLQPVSSIHEIYSAAIMGFPTKSRDFRNLRQCYKAYDMKAET